MAKVKTSEPPTMIAPPKPAPTGPTGLRRWFRPRVLLLLAVIAGMATSYPAWKTWLPNLNGRSEYIVRAEQIHITQPPHWVPRNLIEQVVQQANLPEEFSLLDDDLTQEIAEAFQLHPWVEEVVSVTKSFPPKIEVNLKYRRPAAMVQVKEGLYPVDPAGILLPPEDFAVSETKLYPLITGVHSTPQGPAGSGWGDTVVTDGAALADALAPHWKKLRLTAIECPRPASAQAPRDAGLYVLTAEGGSRILWGRAPGNKQPGEPSTEQKIGRLKDYISRWHSFDLPKGPYEIDIRHWREISRIPLTAGVESPERIRQ